MARNPVAANLLMLLVIVAGLTSIATMTKEVFPTFPSDTITITVPYPGSSPEEVEEGVLVKIEEAIQDLEGIDKLRSTATENSGVVTVELLPGVDATTVVNRIKVRVDSIASFPTEVESPVIEEVLRRTRVLNLTAYGPLDESALKQLADRLRDGILALPGITQVKVIGSRDYEMTIEVSDATLRQYGVRFDELVAAVRRQSQDLPGGKLRTDDRTISLRSSSQARSADDFRDLVLLSRADGQRVRLGDVATVRDGFRDQPLLSTFNGLPAITLQVDRVGDQNALAISDAVKAFTAEAQSQLPEGVTLHTWWDQTNVLKGRIELLLRNAVQGAILVVLALALFLQPRLAFWVVVGVPFCFLGALMLMNTAWIDQSINVISLFGFILVLGIVVDDAIVTAESAYHVLEQEQQGIDSIIRGVKRVTTATVFGVITTMIAFLPMLFLTEGIAELFSVMATVVILCLAFSILETKFILPAHLRHMHTRSSGQGWLGRCQQFQQGFSDGLKRFAQQQYQPLLQRCLAHRYLVLALFLACLMLAMKLVPSGMVRFVFFPNVPSDFIEMTLQMPEGTPYTVTHAMAQRIADAADTVNARYRESSGSDVDVIEDLQLLSTDDVTASMSAALLPSTERDITSVTLAKWWREAIGPLPGIKALSVDANAGRASIPIDIQLNANELGTLRAAADSVKQALQQYDGVFDIRDTFNAGAPEVDVRLTAEGEALGLGQAELARQVRQAFFGAEIQRLQRGRHEVRVYARLPEQRRNSLETLKDLWVRLPDGRQVPFPVVGELVEQEGISSIQRLNRERIVNVQADVDKALVEPTRILADLEQQVLLQLPQRYPGLRYSLSGEAEEQADNARTLAITGLLVLCLIYAALAIPLRSYTQPLVIMSVIPFGVVGALLGHWLLGKEISVISIIGIVALAGIVVNDSLVLIDDMNHQRRQGALWRDAVARSGVRRFRAVVLTSLTTFVGLLPIQLETSIQAQFLKPMAISVAFGVLFATLVTLLLVPALCWIMDDIRQQLQRLRTAPGMAQ
ncbi:MAG: efflux RND transporter permease subunit [Gammaproteobacteria bacterium]|nr:MAG: efflux RND transporter permease subunit [Gammaproteobacteria bacterium]